MFSCHCAPGYYGIHCTQRSNDCSSGTNQELCGHGTCVDDHVSGHTCICEQGWTTAPGGSACTVDVDECQQANPCSSNPRVQCINTPGSFTCGSCPSGFSGNGYVCDDVNECLLNNGGCSTAPFVRCINAFGSSSCAECPPGYQGDGRSCTFLGPCHINNGGCSPMASCFASAGHVQCFCRPGYQGTGIGPFGCSPGNGSISGPVLPSPDGGVVRTSPCTSGPCQNGGICIPTANAFVCQCQNGYTGSTCQSEVDECLNNPCLNGATCIDQQEGYRCECTNDYQGSNCQDEKPCKLCPLLCYPVCQFLFRLWRQI